MKNMLNTLLSSGLLRAWSFMARAGLSISLIALAARATAQNLVPNWSFEDTGYCSMLLTSEILHAPPWFSANHATPDVYVMDTNNTCGYGMDTTDVIGQWCFQAPFHGNRFAGEYMWEDGGPVKDYIEVELLSPLQSGHTYRVSMEVSLPECYEHALNLFGAYFANDTIFDTTLPNPGVLPVVPQAQFLDPAFFLDVEDWMHVEDSFVATGGERFMVIGSFVDNALANVLYVGGMAWTNGGYYYIDAVQVVDVTITDAIEELEWQVIGTNELMVRWHDNRPIERVMIVDLTGRIIVEQANRTPSGQVRIVFPFKSSPGVYLITAMSDGKRAATKWTRME